MSSRRWLAALATTAALMCGAPASAQAPDTGLVIPLTPAGEGGARLLRILPITEAIVRVTAAPGQAFSTRASLIVPATPRTPVAWRSNVAGDDVVVSTAKLKVAVNRRTGRVAFMEPGGRLLLREPATDARRLLPGDLVTRGGTSHIFLLRQLFDSPADEAFYGLGQHQNGVLNWKGRSADLWQYNSVVSIPFVVSSRGYGLLWDNTSHSWFGDARPFERLSRFRLLDAQGKPGALTAEYFKGKDLRQALVTLRDSAIEHRYTDEPGSYPEGFDRNDGSIRWSGALVPDRTGTYTLRLWSSEYVKLWVNGKLVVDTWRQNWHPWTDIVPVAATAGKPVALRLEWIPNGGFIGLDARTPEPAATAGKLALTSAVGDQIDYYVIRGDDLEGVIRGYRQLTGAAPMAPRWAMGLWQSRERYQSQQQLLDVVRDFRKRQVPLDNIVQDWFYWPEDKWGSHDFDLARYPDAAAMVDTLHRQLHAHVMISVWAKFYESTDNYRVLRDSGWVYPWKIQHQEKDWVGPGYVSTFYDAFSPAARHRYFEQVRAKLITKGFDAWWLDSVEPDMGDVPSPTERLARMDPTALGPAHLVENAYPLVHNGGFYQQLRDAVPDRRAFILTRSAYAGQQRYGTAVWSGDVASRWEALRAQIPAGLNFSLAGFPYWTTDIGGFAPERRYEKPDSADLEEWRELNTRWFQFGTFCPLLRVHGQFPLREMFNVAPPEHPAYQAMLAYDRLRYRLMPYLYSLAGAVTQEGSTIMRALPMDFGADARARDIPDEYMFGPALLVAPVTTYRARSRPVYLPAGNPWYELKTGRRLMGGQTVQAVAPYADIPLFVRAGAILPTGPALQYADEKPADPVRLHVYTGRDGAFTLYEDDGVSYAYEQGASSSIPLRWNEASRTLTIGARRGEYPGMLKERTFEVVFVGPREARGLDFERKADRVVKYDGREVRVHE